MVKSGKLPPIPSHYSRALAGVIQAMLNLNVSSANPDVAHMLIRKPTRRPSTTDLLEMDEMKTQRKLFTLQNQYVMASALEPFMTPSLAHQPERPCSNAAKTNLMCMKLASKPESRRSWKEKRSFYSARLQYRLEKPRSPPERRSSATHKRLTTRLRKPSNCNGIDIGKRTRLSKSEHVHSRQRWQHGSRNNNRRDRGFRLSERAARMQDHHVGHHSRSESELR